MRTVRRKHRGRTVTRACVVLWLPRQSDEDAGVRGGSRYLSDVRKHVPKRRCRI